MVALFTLVYSSDLTREYVYPANDMAVDRDNGNLVILERASKSEFHVIQLYFIVDIVSFFAF